MPAVYAAALIVVAHAFLLHTRLSADSTTSQRDSIGYWNTLMADKREEFLSLRDAVDIFERLAREETNSFKSVVAEDRIRLHQISYLLASNHGNPYEFRLVCGEMESQTAKFNKACDRMEFILKLIDMRINIASKAKSELESIKTLDPPPKTLDEVTETLAMIDKFLVRFTKLRQDVQDSLVPGREQLAARKASIQSLNSEICRHLKINFFISSGTLFNRNFRVFMAPIMTHWTITLPMLIKHKMPDNPWEWTRFLMISILGSVALFLSLSFCLRKWFLSIAARSNDAAKRIRLSFLFLSIAAATFFGALLLDMPENILFYRLTLISVAAWGLEMGWGLRLLLFNVSRPVSPLRPIFATYAFASLLQMFDSPPALLTILWPPCMILLAFRMASILKDKGLMKFQKSIAMSTIAVAIALAILSAAGFSQMALFISMVWFVLTVSFQFGSAVSLLLKRMLASSKSFGGALRPLLIGMAIPGAWLAVISISLCWVTNQIVDINAFIHLTTAEFSVFGVSVSMSKIIFAAFLFFAVRTSLGVLYSAMDKNCPETDSRIGVLDPVKSLLATLFWIAYSLVILAMLGIELSHLGVILGGLSVGVGFGLQHFVDNLVSGLLLIFGRDIRQGDIIEMGGIWAKIERITMRSTLACTAENAIITIPNSIILNSQFTNWTLNNRHIRKDMKFILAFGSDVELAREILMRIATSQPEIMKLPLPETFISSVGPNSTELTLRAWILDIDKAHSVLSEVNKSVNMAFSESRGRIAFPGNASTLFPS